MLLAGFECVVANYFQHFATVKCVAAVRLSLYAKRIPMFLGIKKTLPMLGMVQLIFENSENRVG